MIMTGQLCFYSLFAKPFICLCLFIWLKAENNEDKDLLPFLGI